MTQESDHELYLEHHTRQARLKGYTPEAVWKNEKSQIIRFQVLAQLFRSRGGFSVVDVGCGLGDFYAFLRKNGYTDVQYTGIDLNKEFIDEAARRYPDARFVHADLAHYLRHSESQFDYAVASGIYGLGHDVRVGWRRVRKEMKLLHDHVRIGLGVNFLSIYCDTRDELNIYFDPARMLNLGIRIFGRYVRLYQDYLFHDFTLLLFKTKNEDPLFPG